MRRIALDGPAGSGKSTVAKIISKRLGIEYLDTGAMYRAVTLYFLDNRIDMDDQSAVEKALADIKIDFLSGAIYLNGTDVSERIREPIIANNVSKTASMKIVRQEMVRQQQEMAGRKEIIMDGRDIGTVVLPDTKYKFYLTASIEERATRRYEELIEKGFDVSIDQIKQDIANRDYQDMNRDESPLIQASDAILIDTTSLDIEGVVEVLLKHIAEIVE